LALKDNRENTPKNLFIVHIFIINVEKQYYCISPKLCQILPSLFV